MKRIKLKTGNEDVSVVTSSSDSLYDTSSVESYLSMLASRRNLSNLSDFELKSELDAVKARREGRMLFEDDFEGNSLDESMWNVDDGFFNKRMWYVNSKENVLVNNSQLIITCSKNSFSGKTSAGQIHTRGNFDFGGNVRIEGKFKMPTISGFWPAFWTWGSDCYSVRNGASDYSELDIFEIFGSSPRIDVNFWSGDSVGDGTTAGVENKNFTIRNNDEKWHIYRADIYANKIEVYFDGVLFGTFDTTSVKGSMYYKLRQYLLVSVQMWERDTISPNIEDAQLRCDWIRVYALSDGNQYPDSIVLKETSVTLRVGDKYRILCDTPNSFDRTIKYIIQDEAIVSHGDMVVSEIVAKSPGKTKVLLRTRNGRSAIFNVTVNE